MASLSTIVGSILKDIIAAQHAANKYSLALSAQYGTNGKLKTFPLPAAVISDLNLDVKYAIKDITSKVPSKKVNYHKLYKKYEEAAHQFADAIVLGLMKCLKDADEIRGNQQFLELYSKIALNAEARDKFCDFLRAKIVARLKETTESFLDADKGIIREPEILDVLVELARSELAQHTELISCFQGDAWNAFLSKAMDTVRSNLGCYTSRLPESHFFVKDAEVSLNILSTAEEMKDMSPDSMHTLGLHISPRQYSLIKGPGDEDEFVLNPVANHLS